MHKRQGLTKVFTPEEAGELLKVDTSTILRWIREGRLRAFKLGPRFWRIREEDLVKFMKGRGA